MHKYSLEEGKLLVNAARTAIELSLRMEHLKNDIIYKRVSGLSYKDGVFVTIEHYPTRTLRGCMGYHSGREDIGKSVIEAALSSAFEDSRFTPLSLKELNHITIEVSILTEPKEITGSAETRNRKIKIGKDGLIVRYGFHEGLLLPIVAVEQGWDSKKFLEEVCIKAGISHEMWRQPAVKFYTFETQVFKEESPEGNVIERHIKNVH